MRATWSLVLSFLGLVRQLLPILAGESSHLAPRDEAASRGARRLLFRKQFLYKCLVSLAFAVPSFSPADETGPADAAEASKESPKGPRLAITISEETTRIVSPLREDGYVDYVAALNEHGSRGVTPENNAAVLFWQAMGPAEISEKIRDRYFQLLGIPRLPDEGDYFASFGEYLKVRGTDWDKKVDDQFDRALERPWSKKECPIVAGWLKANEKPLRLLTEATRRPRFYRPLIAQEESDLLIAVLLPGISESREAARALIARTMFRLHEGKIEEAWDDLLACHRLARLVGQGPTLIDALVGIAIDGIACSGDAVLTHSGKLSAEQARKFQDDLRKLAPLPKMIDKLDMGERFFYLDSVAAIAREGPQAIQEMTDGMGSKKHTIHGTLMKWATNAAVDWDEVLKIGNSFYDKLAEGCRKPTFAERSEALEKLDDEIERIVANTRDPMSVAKDLLAGKSPRKVAGERMGGVFLALLAPALSTAMKVEDRATTQVRLTEVALALGGYHGDHGAYPPNLSKLRPKYVDELPTDLFTEKDFRYQRQDKGYLLYSVGPNREDDGGRNAQQDPEAEDDPDYQGDDFAVRTPRGRGG